VLLRELLSDGGARAVVVSMHGGLFRVQHLQLQSRKQLVDGAIGLTKNYSVNRQLCRGH
jgi:hypothetical protein